MRLHHFTSRQHLPSILEDGLLRPTESNVGTLYPVAGFPSGLHAGPEVVWLLDSETVDHGHGLVLPQMPGVAHDVDKTEVRITVDVPAIRWLDWEWADRMEPRWRAVMTESAGGIEAVQHWYVLPAPIRRTRWREIAIRDIFGDYIPIPIELPE